MTKNPVYELIVFDWDGTLMDSAARIISSFHSAIAAAGLPPRSDAEIQHIIGLGMREAVLRLYPGIADDAVERLIEAYRVEYLETCTVPTPLFDGATAAITELHETGYQLAVATSKSRRGLVKAFAQCGLEPYFHATRTADETRSKPDPLMLREILQELAVAPERALMIGDSEYDLEMANNAGVPHIAVSYGVHDCARLRNCHPLTCIHDLRELPVWLKEHASC